MSSMNGKLRWLTVIFVLVAAACASTGDRQPANGPEARAHDFMLPDQDGRMVRLSDVLDVHSGAVIAFYPKDDSRY